MTGPASVSMREGKIPGALIIEAASERRVLLAFASGRAVTTGDGESFTLDPHGAELHFLGSGRAPLLADHRWEIASVIGVIETAWVEDGTALAIARLRKSKAGDEAWEGIEAGFLRNVSCGYRFSHRHVIDLGSHRYRAKSWTPFEISLVAVPADATANVAAAEASFGELAALVASKKAEFEAQAAAARAAALRAPQWLAWAETAAKELAELSGQDQSAFAPHLSRLVAAHLDSL